MVYDRQGGNHTSNKVILRTLGRPALSKNWSLLHAQSLHKCSVTYQLPLSRPPLEASVPSEKQRLLFERNTDLPHGSIWATAVTGVVNDLETVTYNVEEHLEMKPPYPVSKQQRPVFINSNHNEEVMRQVCGLIPVAPRQATDLAAALWDHRALTDQ